MGCWESKVDVGGDSDFGTHAADQSTKTHTRADADKLYHHTPFTRRHWLTATHFHEDGDYFRTSSTTEDESYLNNKTIIHPEECLHCPHPRLRLLRAHLQVNRSIPQRRHRFPPTFSKPKMAFPSTTGAVSMMWTVLMVFVTVMMGEPVSFPSLPFHGSDGYENASTVSITTPTTSPVATCLS
ncbi:hypothetical protein IW262DRAFT_537912 [Armillaria fumosa]|nr:hypothetical protein IW262DRAFT_537912 [Armillaria fumosa]